MRLEVTKLIFFIIYWDLHFCGCSSLAEATTCTPACATKIASYACTGGNLTSDNPCRNPRCQCQKGYTACRATAPRNQTAFKCVLFTVDRLHCGACSTYCMDNQVCGNSTCQACRPNFTVCNNRCVDPQTDEANCGGCGQRCGSGQTCNNRTCGCPGGQTRCVNRFGSVCSTLQDDSFNCGACGNSCPPPSSCINRDCDCPADVTLNGSDCRKPSSTQIVPQGYQSPPPNQSPSG